MFAEAVSHRAARGQRGCRLVDNDDVEALELCLVLPE
jgi:hypothetical protein